MAKHRRPGRLMKQLSRDIARPVFDRTIDIYSTSQYRVTTTANASYYTSTIVMPGGVITALVKHTCAPPVTKEVSPGVYCHSYKIREEFS